MAKNNKQVYVITSKIQEKIIHYCYEVLNSINKDYLTENEVYENEFLEYVYLGCKQIFELTGKFELTKEDIIFLIYSRKQSDRIITELKNGNAKLIGINKDDDLIFEFKDKETFVNFNNLKKENE